MDCNNPDIGQRTVWQYASGIVGIELGEDVLSNILSDRGLYPCDLASDMSKKQRMLLKADVYVACANLPGTSVSIEDADGNWKHKESGGQITEADKRIWLKLADRIYAKYGEVTSLSCPRIISRGMKIWREDQ